MLFNSLEFVILVIVTMALFYLPRLRFAQIAVLIVASFIFYGSHNPVLLTLLLLSVVVNTVASWLVTYSQRKKFWAFAGVFINLALLGFFKYAGLIGNTFGAAENIAEFLSAIPLPIGISFFTFQGLSLVVDVLSKDVDISETVAEGNKEVGFGQHFLSTAFYVSFFPQLVAGPIVKANEFFPQIGQKYFKQIRWTSCFENLVLGYFLKMFVADNLKDQTFWIQYPYFLNRSAIDLLVMLFGYSMQIFADFAGYSLIAIGVAGLFGYYLPKNFEFPYIASSFSEFWRRWHISLSTWLRDYLYFPLGGNRKGAKRTYFNLFVVMFLGGLWHGAAWSYAIWGTMHGLALAVERFLGPRLPVFSSAFATWVKRLGVFLFVTFAWLLFKLPEFGHVVAFFTSLFQNFGMKPDLATLYYVLFFSAPVVLYHLHYLLGDSKWKAPIRPVAFGVMLFLILFNSGTSGEFIYFQF